MIDTWVAGFQSDRGTNEGNQHLDELFVVVKFHCFLASDHARCAASHRTRSAQETESGRWEIWWALFVDPGGSVRQLFIFSFICATIMTFELPSARDSPGFFVRKVAVPRVCQFVWVFRLYRVTLFSALCFTPPSHLCRRRGAPTRRPHPIGPARCRDGIVCKHEAHSYARSIEPHASRVWLEFGLTYDVVPTTRGFDVVKVFASAHCAVASERDERRTDGEKPNSGL